MNLQPHWRAYRVTRMQVHPLLYSTRQPQPQPHPQPQTSIELLPPALAVQDGEVADRLEINRTLWAISSPQAAHAVLLPEMALVIWTWLAAIR